MRKNLVYEVLFLMVIFLGTVIMSTVGFARTCTEIRSDVIRLHILANSDNAYDQNLKLKVRDAVLKEGADIFSGNTTKTEALKSISVNKDRLKNIAEKTIRENGYSYKATVRLEDEYFETRSYGEITMPAGKYTAVRILIGSGEGKNWWCVMFPPLCLPAAKGEAYVDTFLNGNEVEVVKAQPKYEPRFKIVEWCERLFDR